jgi:peptide deformylase
MKPLEVRKYPDKVLRKPAVKLEAVGEKEVKLFNDMLYTMTHFYGVGLAAPQVGVSKCLIVVDIGDGPVKLANPQIVKTKGVAKMKEGCLSVPGIDIEIERPYEILVSALNEFGESIEIKAKGLFARVIQHEVDHLNGKIIIDYLKFLDRIKCGFRLKK